MNAYERTKTPNGPALREMSETAVLNANYVLALLKDAYDLPYDRLCMHEFVLSARSLKREHGVTALDVAKRLMDHGIHPPTIYFPLVVQEALGHVEGGHAVLALERPRREHELVHAEPVVRQVVRVPEQREDVVRVQHRGL